MPIRWSALKVKEAAGMMEEFVYQAAVPLEQARIVAQEARNIPNLPQYVDQHLLRIIGEIERAIGGSQFEPVGRLRACIESIRNDLPEGSVETEQNKLKRGTTVALM